MSEAEEEVKVEDKQVRLSAHAECHGPPPVRNRYVPVRGLPQISAKCRVHPCQSALFRMRAAIMSLHALPLS